MRKKSVRLDREWGFVAAGTMLAVVGWVVNGTYLAVAGVLVVATALLLWVWGRESLAAVEYTRRLSCRRATFGESVSMDVELVNDKLLPLTWLHVREQVPAALRVGGAVVSAGWRTELQFVVSMLPYQRMRRRFALHCDQRGEHIFGPAELRSGSPLGTREQRREIRNETTLLVYPKVAPLSEPLVAARVPVPDRRVPRSLALDPTRVVGVRRYLPGDPIRHIDWRATARHGDLLVRVHEPATTLGVAVFVDLLPPARTTSSVATDLTELVVSVAASVVSHFVAAGVPTGIFVNGTSRGSPVAIPISGSAAALPSMLEALARVTTAGAVLLERVILEHRTRLVAGTSALVVAADFSGGVPAAMVDLRRRVAVSALWVSAPYGQGPLPGTADAQWKVAYDSGWKERDVFYVAD